MKKDKKVFTDLFYQDYESIGEPLPNHWAVQYYIIDGNGFPEYEYFDTLKNAENFIRTELIQHTY